MHGRVTVVVLHFPMDGEASLELGASSRAVGLILDHHRLQVPVSNVIHLFCHGVVLVAVSSALPKQ